MTKAVPITLCADDFGIAPGVSQGIVELVEKDRLSAVGCMATDSSLAEFAPDLLKHDGHIDIGLHLVLTDQQCSGAGAALAPGGKFLSAPELMKRAFMGRLAEVDVEAELNRQVDVFVDVFGRPPDFLDGHHHIHQLPGVQGAVLKMAAGRLRDHGSWLRVTAERPGLILRRGVDPLKAIQVGLPGYLFRRRAERFGVNVNTGFSGVYDFSGKVPYARLFERFVIDAGPGTLVMCHPGHVDDELRRADGLTDQRQVEFDYFASDEFARLLENRNLQLRRLLEE